VILVVEDDPDARELTRVMLEQHGAWVVVAADGLEAIHLLTRLRPNAVVCDLRMPRMDGFGFVRQLRADPHWAHLPVVALTAYGADADYMRTFEQGFDAHLMKPVDDVTLASAVLRILRGPRPG
jgi:CheY-like chemotaxis protein